MNEQDGKRSSIQTIKHGARIAAAAVSGNAWKLVADTATDVKETAKVVGFVFFFLAFLIFLVVYCVPVTIYEGLQGFVRNLRTQAVQLKEAWAEGMYSGAGNFLQRLGKAFSGAGREVLSDIQGLFAKGRDRDEYSVEDLGVINNTPDLKHVYERKIEAAREKLTARADELYQAIVRSGILQAALYERFLQDYGNGRFEGNYDEVVYEQPEISNISSSLSGRDAISLMCLYSVMREGSEDPYELSGFMKWIGWNAGGGRQTRIWIADTGQWTTVNAWKGEYLPMYLEEERTANPDRDFSGYMCSAADLLLKITMPSVRSAFAFTYEETVSRPKQEELSEIVISDEVLNSEEPEMEDRHILHVAYHYSINIRVRSLQEIIEMTGLWNASLDETVNRILWGNANA